MNSPFVCAAGFGQMVEMTGILAKLLADEEFKIRQAEAVSLKRQLNRHITNDQIMNDQFVGLH